MIELSFNSAGLWNAKVNAHQYIISADDDKAYIYLQEHPASRICIETGLRNDLLSTLLEHFLNHLKLDSLSIPDIFKVSNNLEDDLNCLLRGIGGQQHLSVYHDDEHPNAPGAMIYHETCFKDGTFRYIDKNNHAYLSIAKTCDLHNLRITIEKFNKNWSRQAEAVYYLGDWNHLYGPLTPKSVMALIVDKDL